MVEVTVVAIGQIEGIVGVILLRVARTETLEIETVKVVAEEIAL